MAGVNLFLKHKQIRSISLNARGSGVKDTVDMGHDVSSNTIKLSIKCQFF